MTEPLTPEVATTAIKALVKDGDISWSTHVRQEMLKDGFTTVDCLNVLRAGAVTESADFEGGTWRYRVHTNRMCVVVAFRSDTELRVITTWRKRR